jgi:hypothetical protein
MSKFIKRVLKTSGIKAANVILIGNNSDHISDLVEGMNTIFYVDDTPAPKVRNIIPLKDIGFLNDLNDIHIVFINRGFDNNILQFLVPLTRRCTPAIFLNQAYPINRDYYDLFKRIHYEQITILEPYQIWKVIRK